MTARAFTHRRQARLSECDPSWRLRLDAIACWLQDAAYEDVLDGGLDDSDGVWIVRRTLIEVRQWPRLYQDYEVRTWASATGATFAERRTTIGGGLVDATALWVALDPVTQRPMRLSERFWSVYGEAAAGRRATAKLTHPDPPPGAGGVEFPLRFADLDRVGHVNNAVYFEAVEELSAGSQAPARVEVEYRGGLERGSAVTVVTAEDMVWFVQGGAVGASARVG